MTCFPRSLGNFRICVFKLWWLQGRLWPRAGEAPTSREKASFSGKVPSLPQRWALCSALGRWAWAGGRSSREGHPSQGVARLMGDAGAGFFLGNS